MLYIFTITMNSANMDVFDLVYYHISIYVYSKDMQYCVVYMCT